MKGIKLSKTGKQFLISIKQDTKCYNEILDNRHDGIHFKKRKIS